ncbi:MAG TPA: hypothetical protein VFI09_03545 [Solirubrobacterales bacterium]|nr:hypothetical protein [Solirubrobacterales bacterium]
MSRKAAASPSELAAELGRLLRSGVTTDGLRDCAQVLGLALVKAKSASNESADLAVAAHTLMTEAAKRADDGAFGPAATLLGLAPGTRSTMLKDRRRQAAELLHVSTEHLRKDREPLLIEAVADESCTRPTAPTGSGTATAPNRSANRSAQGSGSTGWSSTGPTGVSGRRSRV